jgi:hypothetical protein
MLALVLRSPSVSRGVVLGLLPDGGFGFLCFTRLKEIGPNYGYFPEPSKSILIVPQHSFEHASSVFADLGFKVTTGSRYYLSGFIGEKGALDVWIQEKIDNWSGAVVEF